MLHHVSIGVADVQRAAQFYDAVLAKLGFKRVMEVIPYGIAYGRNMPQFWIQLPHDHNASSSGNGTHIAFDAGSRAAVDAFYETALAAGGKDEGAPGARPEYTPEYYGAFVRDLDGNKIEAVYLPMTGRAAGAATKAAKSKSRQAKPARKAAAPKSRSARPSASRGNKRGRKR